MKKRLIQFALLLCLAALTCLAAGASDADAEEPASGFRKVESTSADVKLEPLNEGNATVTSPDDMRYPGAAKMKISYSNAQDGSEYLLCVLLDDGSDKPAPNVNNLVYIDQVTAKGKSVDFTAFPKATTEKSVKYAVCLSSNADAGDGDAGITGFTKVGTFEYYATASSADVTLGDVDADEDVTISDAVMVLQALVEEIKLTEKEEAAADVDGDSEVTISDAVAILQYLVEEIKSFEEIRVK